MQVFWYQKILFYDYYILYIYYILASKGYSCVASLLQSRDRFGRYISQEVSRTSNGERNIYIDDQMNVIMYEKKDKFDLIGAELSIER